MSRIFDALRQSEKDKQPGTDSLFQFPGMPAPESSSSVEDETSSLAASPEPLDEEFIGLVPEAEYAMPFALPKELETTRRTYQDAVSEVSPLSPVGEAKTLLDVQRLVADALAGAGVASPVQPHLEADGPLIDLSKLKVIEESSIKSPFLVALNNERELGAEKFRVLGARLSNIRLGATLKMLQVTSSVVGEGKTLTSVNLAMTLAKRFAQKVLLVEGDLRKPAVCEMLGLTNRLGIGDWWQEQNAPVSNFMLRIGETGMCLLPAGNAVHPASVLQSQRLPEMLSGLTRVFDWIIIDTPPLLPMADSNQWSRIADGTLFVVRRGAVSRAALKKAVESIDNPKLVGIVLNDASDYDRVNYYDQYYTPKIEGGSLQREEASQ
jgi:capsular exopolysaccharide synthesis family protein